MKYISGKTIGLGLLLTLPLISPAVIISSGDGTGNTTAPTGDQGWSYVGSINKGSVTSSVTYIGNNWFITANHIKELDNPSSINFDGNTHSITEWSDQLSYGGNDADLIMFRVDGSISVPDVSFYSGSVTSGTDVTMTGYGRNRATSGTTWHIDTDMDPDEWSETFTLGVTDISRTGYKWGSGSSKRWGTNEVHSTGININTGYGITSTFNTRFNSGAGDNEAQGATYDSGGGVFVENGVDWELAGIMIATGGTFDGQPGSISVINNLTYIADISDYQTQIESIMVVPEMGSLSLMGLILLGCGLCYIKKRT